MEDVIIKGLDLEALITKSIPKILTDKFTDSYGNPLREAIEAVLKEQDGAIKTFVRDVLADIISNPDLKTKISNEVVMAIVQKGLRS